MTQGFLSTNDEHDLDGNGIRAVGGNLMFLEQVQNPFFT